MLVKDVMSARLVMVKPRETIYAALKLMVANNISGVIVEDERKAAGVVTMKDICRRVLVADRDIYKTTVGDVMSKPVLTVKMLETVEAAAKLMSEKNVRRLVVVDEMNKAVGIVTVMDIVSKLPKLVDVMFRTWVRPDWR
ncbi:MAG: CBS domain-containing protein [Candidatus Altiarchaeota archaeon]